MDINFLPEEERKSKSVRHRNYLQKAVEWSHPQEKLDEVKNKLSKGKVNISGYLSAIFNNIFSRKKNGVSPSFVNQLSDRKKVSESRKELLKLVNRHKEEISHLASADKKEKPRESNVIKKKKIYFSGFNNFFSFFSDIFRKTKQLLQKEGKPARFSGPRENVAVPEEKSEDKQEEQEEKKDNLVFETKKQGEPEEFQTIETNLIKDEIVAFFNWKSSIVFLLVSVFLSILAIGGVYGFLYWLGEKEGEEGQYLSQRFLKMDKEVGQIEKEVEAVLLFKQKLSLVNPILTRHIYWTNFFKFLEDNTLSDVYYSDFSGDNKGEYVLSANAKNFGAIEAQVKQFLKNKYVLEANVTEANIAGSDKNNKGGSAGVTFELKLTIDPAIFNK